MEASKEKAEMNCSMEKLMQLCPLLCMMRQQQICKAEVLKKAPCFEGIAWDCKLGFKKVKLSDYAGRYLVLFFYPMDFTFVCPTEILKFSEFFEKFKENECDVLACSGDSQYVHMEYTLKPKNRGGLGPVNMPLLADSSHKIAKAFGAYIDSGENEGVCLRQTVIIDRNQIVRHISQNDLGVGRSIEEILRLVEAFQYVDIHGEVCPSGWKKGGKTIVPDPNSEKTKEFWKDSDKKPEVPEEKDKK